MDSKSTSPDAPDLLAAMFQNASIDKAERSEFSNSARDMFKFAVNNYFNFTKEGENMVFESSDAIEFFRNVVQPFLAEVRKNDQSRSTPDGSAGAGGSDPVIQSVTTDTLEGDPVNICDLVPPEPSSLPVASVADRYTRSMLKCLAGYPLYEPQPFSGLSTAYLRNGVNVGDVGFVRGTGVFDFLFNICPSKNSLINPSNLPTGFSLETVETEDHSATRAHLPKTGLLQSPMTRTKSGEYICEGSEGAVLELPDGAIQDEATNIRPFSKLAARHGVQWYEYTMRRGREISNGSLYLITSVTKCAQWGIAVFDRPCAPGQGLKFNKKRAIPFGKPSSKYHWTGSHLFTAKVSDLNQGDPPNQCVFLRGYKIMIRQDIFDKLCNDQFRRSDLEMHSPSSLSTPKGDIKMTRDKATRIRGGGDTDPSKKPLGRSLLSRTPLSTMTKSDEVVLHANFNSSLVHPSDFINAGLLSQNPEAKVALTHDDVWCDLLRDNFPKLRSEALISIGQSYTTTVDEYGCVTLDKISNLISVLEDSYRSSLEVQTLAFQESHATPGDDHTHISDANSVTLPSELVERILLFLDINSMLKCRLANRAFNEIIQTSTLLQYILACKAAGVVDNPRSSHSYAERLKALKMCEDAWRKLKPGFEITINLDRRNISLVRPRGDTLFVGDINRKDLNYCRLPSSPQEKLHWIRIPGHGPALDWSGILVNFATAIDEHDLIVNFISSETVNQMNIQRYSLDFVLLQFSTGDYHPLARQPRIHVRTSGELDLNPASVISRIVGENLALVVKNDDETLPSKLFIFDWKTGHKRLEHGSTAGRAYRSLTFVSSEFLLVPNCLLFHFEVWHIPHQQNDPNIPIQILSLQMPVMSPGYSISSFRCYGEPSSFLHPVPYVRPRPFYSSPEDSVIIATIRMSSNFSPDKPYNFIMRRRALLDMIQKRTSLEQKQDQPIWLTNEVVVLKTADSEDESVRLCAQSKSVPRTSHPRAPESPRSDAESPALAISSLADSGSSSVSSISRCTLVLQVPWAQWGPPISRWFQVNIPQVRWYKISNGQRYVFSERSRHDRNKLVVAVADFNPHSYKRNAEIMVRPRGEGEHTDSNGKYEQGKTEEGEEEWEMLDHGGIFSEEVRMGLKCVIHRAPDEYDFDLVLMDEERLFGVKLNSEGWEKSIKVLYIG